MLMYVRRATLALLDLVIQLALVGVYGIVTNAATRAGSSGYSAGASFIQGVGIAAIFAGWSGYAPLYVLANVLTNARLRRLALSEAAYLVTAVIFMWEPLLRGQIEFIVLLTYGFVVVAVVNLASWRFARGSLQPKP